MAQLTPEQRNALPDEAFALPERREYPIQDKTHAVDSLARVGGSGSPDEQRRVAMAVHRKYPEMRAQMHKLAGE